MRALFLLSLCCFAFSSIHDIDLTFPVASGIRFTEGPLYGPNETFAIYDPLVEWDGTVSLQKPQQVNFYFVSYGEANKDYVGFSEGLSFYSCCTAGLKSKGICSNIGELLLKPNAPKPPIVYEHPINSSALSVKIRGGEWNRKVYLTPTDVGLIERSGNQWLLLCVCGADSNNTVTLKGEISFLNPYGYLPGEYFGWLPFYAAANVFSFLLLSIYIFWGIKWHDRIVNLHRYVFVVLGLTLFEYIIFFLALVRVNDSGEPFCCPMPPLLVFAVLTSVVRMTVSRVLLIAVCNGFGVTCERLDRKRKSALWILGGCYFIFSLLAETRRVMGKQDGQGLLDSCVLLLNIIFVVWSILAIVEQCDRLLRQGQEVKAKMFKKLFNVCCFFMGVFSLLTLLLFVVSEGIIKLSWKYNFLFSCFFEIVYLCLLATISIIWRPSELSDAYAFSAQLPSSEREAEMVERDDGLPQDEDDEVAIDLFPPSAVPIGEDGPEDDLDSDKEEEEEVEEGEVELQMEDTSESE